MKQFLIIILVLNLLNFVTCEDEFLVKINNKYIYPVSDEVILTPSKFDDLKSVTEIQFIKQNNNHLPKPVKISNFTYLNKLFIENQFLKTAPIMENMLLGEVSLGYNQIEVITNKTFATAFSNDFIYLHANQIHTIEDNSFPTLDAIVLSCNNLTTFKSSWFQTPSRLRTIYMRNNKITNLEKNAFKDIIHLRHLVLASNQIKQISDGIFNYRNTHTLDLRNNKLYELKASWFVNNNVTVTRLKIEFNRLSYLTDDFMNNVRVYYAFLSGNPWQCPCLKLIKKWMQEFVVYHWVIDEYKDVLPVCVYATSFKDICIQHIEEELYQTYIKGIDIPFKEEECSSL